MLHRTDEAGRAVPDDRRQRAARNIHVAAHQDIAQRRQHVLCRSDKTTERCLPSPFYGGASFVSASSQLRLIMQMDVTNNCPGGGIPTLRTVHAAHLQVAGSILGIGERDDSPGWDPHGLVERQLHAQQTLQRAPDSLACVDDRQAALQNATAV